MKQIWRKSRAVIGAQAFCQFDHARAVSSGNALAFFNEGNAENFFIQIGSRFRLTGG